jgi:hypothetical protein
MPVTAGLPSWPSTVQLVQARHSAKGQPLAVGGRPSPGVETLSQALPRMRLRFVEQTGQVAFAIRVPLSLTTT